MSQCSEVLSMLKRGPVTPLDALDRIGCMRLAARVADLRSQGHTITTEIVEQGGKRFAKYRLVRRTNR